MSLTAFQTSKTSSPGYPAWQPQIFNSHHPHLLIIRFITDRNTLDPLAALNLSCRSPRLFNAG